MAYRTEHPKPQFMRDDWTCLNGTWDFAFDPGISGEARGMQYLFVRKAGFPELAILTICIPCGIAVVSV